ncbi:hypothetical protein GCM10009687_40240 [Asanoa iriomotensis]|uniref:Uncharacterized protein n=2 Tax=Asanoa iriomotensis TaxID=234613 RepID=A0ABQ4C026_9ACTN|nr:hypothetical protein Air01nite_17550 [Asanoa iriomotensis]
MSTGQYFSQYHMPFDPDIPEADRRMAAEVAEDYDRRQRNTAEARGDKVAEIVERGNRRIAELLGEENWLSLRRRMRGERTRFRDLLQPPNGLNADYEALNQQRRKNVQAYFDSLNVDEGQLRRIVAETKAAVLEATPTTQAEGGHAAWLHDAQGPTTAQQDAANAPLAWTAFRPPFPAFQHGFDPHNLGGFRVSRTVDIDRFAGLVSHQIMLDNNDADDFDNGWAVADAQIGFNFRAAATGVLEIFIEARCGLGRHELRVEDEFGTSDSSTTQENFLMAHVLHPNVTAPSFALMSRFNWVTDSTAVVAREFLTQGGAFTARLFSNGPVQLGQTVHIRAGTRSSDGSVTNDMEINSKSNFRWVINAVWVRTAQ